MLGILIHSRDVETARRLSEESDAFQPDRIVRRCLHWHLLVFDDAQYLEVQAVTARLLGLRELGKTSDAPKILDNETTAALLSAMSQPKVGDLTPAEERGMKRGYQALATAGIIGHTNAAAHQAWVTMKVERHAIAHGLWTHDVTVTFELDGQHRETLHDRAVSDDHARRNAAKMRHDIRTRLGVKFRDPALQFSTTITRIKPNNPIRLTVGFDASSGHYAPASEDLGRLLNTVDPAETPAGDAVAEAIIRAAERAQVLMECV